MAESTPTKPKLNAAASAWTPNIAAKEWTPVSFAKTNGSSPAEPPSNTAPVAVEACDSVPAELEQSTESAVTSQNGHSSPHNAAAAAAAAVSPLASPTMTARSPGRQSRSQSPLRAPQTGDSSSTPAGLDVDPVTTRKLYDIADLLSMRPSEATRPSALNPPPDLNILWDGKDVGEGTGAASSSWSAMGSAASDGGSGFNTPRGGDSSRQSGSSRGNGSGSVPRGGNGPGSNSSRGGGRDRRDGRGGGGGGGSGGGNSRRPSVIDTAPALEDCEPIKINEATRWKAKHMLDEEAAAKQAANAEDPAVVMRRAIALLNKMTLEKFDKLSAAFVDVGFTTEALVDEIIGTLVEKAQSETHFSGMYAKLCLRLSEARLPAFQDEKGGGKMFRRMLLVHCQAEFTKDTAGIIQGIKDDESLQDDEKAEKELIIKRRYNGHMRFIGELYKVGLLKEKFVHYSFDDLLPQDQEEDPDEEKLECMIKLMITVGKQLEQTASTAEFVAKVNKYFKVIKKLSQDTKRVSSRLRFMLRDLMELRDHNWVPRRAEEKAKTIAQIHEQVAKEEEAKARDSRKSDRRGSTTSAPPGGIRPSSSSSSAALNGGSQDVRAGANSSSSSSSKANAPAVTDDGWETVPTKKKAGGGRSDTDGWSAAAKSAKAAKGASSSSSSATSKPPRSSSSQGSAFAVLGLDAEKRRSSSSKDKSSSSSSSSSRKEHKDKDRQSSRSSASSSSSSSKKDKASSSSSSSSSAAKTAEAEASSSKQQQQQQRAEVTEKEARRVAKAAIEEFAVSCELSEALLCIKELEAPQHHWAIVSEGLSMALDRKDRDRDALTRLLCAAGAGAQGAPEGEGALLTLDDVARGCSDVADFLPDLEIDIPLASKHAAQIFGALVAGKALSLSIFSPANVEQRMPELRNSGRAAAFAVDVLACTQAALTGEDTAAQLQALAAECEPPLNAALLAQLLPPPEAAAAAAADSTNGEAPAVEDSRASVVAALLQAKSIEL